LRAAATVLVILLHAGVPYCVTPMQGLAWPVRHPQPSTVVDVLFWAIACCVMPVFFSLSGYGAAQSLAARGPHEFLKGRWQRIGMPLLIFAAVLLPCELYLWLTGWALDGQISWRKLQSLKVDNPDLWGLSHLWYLEYLLVYCALLALWDRVRGRKETQGWQSLGFRGLLRLVALTAAATLVLWWSPEVLVGFQHSFLPVPAKFAFNGAFFAAGVLTFRRTDVQSVLRPTGRGLIPLAGGVAAFAAVFPWLPRQAADGLAGWDRVVLAVGLAGFASMTTAGLWQICTQQQSPSSRGVRFASAASYWTYLVHHPLVALCHIALRPTDWPAVVQFILAAIATTAACWASYAWLVRGSAVDRLLNGQTMTPQPVEDVAVPARRAA
jgi:glucan biosynthesis protein C